MAGINGKVYADASGNALIVASGGYVDVESGGQLRVAGTAVTSSAAELNILDGVTSSTAELNILDGVTASAAELNLVDGSVAGTAVASKAAVLGANKELSEFHTAGLYLGAGAGTAVTATAAEINKLAGLTGTPLVAQRINFSESTGAGTYTGSVTVPGGAFLVDIIVVSDSLWTATTSASMDVGDTADPNGFYAAINLKATDLLVGESISFAHAGGKEGAYIANSQVSARRSASDRTLSAVVTTVGAAGNAGQTFVTVIWALPAAGDVVTATKA